jgi:hypothetical protein
VNCILIGIVKSSCTQVKRFSSFLRKPFILLFCCRYYPDKSKSLSGFIIIIKITCDRFAWKEIPKFCKEIVDILKVKTDAVRVMVSRKRQSKRWREPFLSFDIGSSLKLLSEEIILLWMKSQTLSFQTSQRCFGKFYYRPDYSYHRSKCDTTCPCNQV